MLRHAALVVCALVALSVGSGCGTYWHNRAADFSRMADIGLTVSSHTSFVFYQCFESIVPVGYGDFDCTILGWGGNEFGAVPHHFEGWGAVAWGNETEGYGDYDLNDPDTLQRAKVSLVGMPSGLSQHYDSPYYFPT